jgi:L-threonylcarbamoyladenylate synthase
VLAPADALKMLRATPAVQVAASADPRDYARDLYSNLHALDAAEVERIVVAAPPRGADWSAIHDRLKRAQAGSHPKPSRK